MTSTHTETLKTLHASLPKQNTNLNPLPPNTTISGRPLLHAPISSAHAGPGTPKIVYISRSTPVIAAVKRVKKYLLASEQRALRAADDADGRTKSRKRANGNGRRGGGDMLEYDDKENLTRLARASEVLGREAEEVIVKASGRAMEQALRVAEWFREREMEVLCEVAVRGGSVSVVDDIVEREGWDAESARAGAEGDDDRGGDADREEKANETTALTGGDTTMELLGDLTTGVPPLSTRNTVPGEDAAMSPHDNVANSAIEDTTIDQPKKTRRRRKRKREVVSLDNVPEARLRWVKTVEIVIKLKA